MVRPAGAAREPGAPREPRCTNGAHHPRAPLALYACARTRRHGKTYKPLADGKYDAIILGTGLKECILSGLLSVKGKKVRGRGGPGRRSPRAAPTRLPCRA